MSTVIRNEITKKSPYYIPKHRYLELKHYCLQYPEWKKQYKLVSISPGSHQINDILDRSHYSDPTADKAMTLHKLSRQMEMIEKAAKITDPELSNYILMAVTEERNFEYLSLIKGIPCCRNTFYNRYRRFFWELDKIR